MILFGADALAWTEQDFSRYIMNRWESDRSSMLRSLDRSASPPARGESHE
jgi:hypothetical protein